MTLDRNRRQSLLDAASQEFGRKGFAGSRVDAIARKAEVNKQLIFYYFGSKRGLFEATLAREAPPGSDHVPVSAPSREHLRAAIRGVLDGFDANPPARAALFDPAMDPARLTRLLEQLERPVAAAVSAGQGLGYFRDSAEPERISRQAVVLCAGWHAMQHAAGPRSAWVDGVVDTLLRALAW